MIRQIFELKESNTFVLRSDRSGLQVEVQNLRGRMEAEHEGKRDLESKQVSKMNGEDETQMRTGQSERGRGRGGEIEGFKQTLEAFKPPQLLLTSLIAQAQKSKQAKVLNIRTVQTQIDKPGPDPVFKPDMFECPNLKFGHPICVHT